MVLDLTLIGLASTLEPVPITAFILLLAGDRGVFKGLFFILAWLACLVLVLAGVAWLTGGKPLLPHSSPSVGALVVKLAIGLGLIVYGERRRRRHRGHEALRAPAWMGRLDRASVWSAAGIAVLVQPWALVAAGAATVTDAHLSSLAAYLLLFYFCILATASPLAMELFAVFAPARAARFLVGLRSWLERHQDQAIVLVSLLLGLWLAGKSIYQLVT